MADDISMDSSDSSDFSRSTRRSGNRETSRDPTPTVLTRSALRNHLNEEISLDSDTLESRPTTRSQRESGPQSDIARLTQDSNKILENFNPETSARERRKLNRKLNPNPNKKVYGAIFDENGSYISDGQNLCDCLFTDCPGCHFPCAKCGSEKCGNECRVNRRYLYECVDIEGRSKTIRNTHGK